MADAEPGGRGTGDESPTEPTLDPDLSQAPPQTAIARVEQVGGDGPGRSVADSSVPGVMSLVDHLSELRDRIIRSILAIAVGAVVGFLIGDPVIEFLRAPLPSDVPLIVTGIGDLFAIRLRIALVAGIILAMPVILYQLWAFIAPGLTPPERQAIRPWLPLALVFFLIGCVIAYVVLPFAAQFLLGFQSKEIDVLLDTRQYFEFVSTMFLAFGLIMEFPIVLVGLARVGILSSDRLRRSRRYVILGIAIFAAAVTPGGDLVSPTALGVTMYVLFELTIFLIRRSGR
jgi:sec-independent protein translocase protein TatC